MTGRRRYDRVVLVADLASLPETILVPVRCADGVQLVPHTRAEFEALWRGVDVEAVAVLDGHELER